MNRSREAGRFWNGKSLVATRLSRTLSGSNKVNAMECNNAIESLVGMPLSKIGRAADLLWLQFGTLREVATQYGEKTIGDWAIHVQTSWRFVRDAQIILSLIHI